MRNVAVSLALMASSVAFATDWNFASSTGSPTEQADLFYDDDSIVRQSTDVLRVWVVTYRPDVLYKYFDHNQKAMVDKVGKRLAARGWPKAMGLPAYLALEKSKRVELAASLAADEAVANEPGTKISSRILFEIDCKGRRYRALTASMFNAAGVLSSSGRSPDAPYDFVAPDTAMDSLRLLVCPG